MRNLPNLTNLHVSRYRSAGSLISLLMLSICMSLSSCHTSRKHAYKGDGKPETSLDVRRDVERVHGIRRAIIEEALTWEGTPYKYASDEKGSGTDCSGMVLRVYEKVMEIKLPRNSKNQSEFCKEIKLKDTEPGDLIFFATGSDKGRVSHVGVIIDKTHFIHASTSKGVVISDITTPYYQRTFLMCGRVPDLR